jgi:hypothetical protein
LDCADIWRQFIANNHAATIVHGHRHCR